MQYSIVVSAVIGIFLIGLVPVFAQTEISDKVVVLTTQSGQMVIELFPGDAPKTVENFLKLTNEKFYDRTLFHRIIKDFMIQGGDPKTKPGAYKQVIEWGTGDAGYTIPGEFNTISHKRGIVSMARGGSPDSASSQFFIIHNDTQALDQNYAVFGRLATKTSYETLDKIANLKTVGDVGNNVPLEWAQGEILKAEVKNRSDIPDLLNQGEPIHVAPKTTESIPYSNDKLGISFIPPAGWFVQEPQKQNAETPDVVAVGDKIGGFTPAISISVKSKDGATLDQYSEKIKKTLEPAIKSKILTVQKEEKTTINGHDAFVREALGKFNMTGGQFSIKFKEVVIESDYKFYILTYTNTENNFDVTLPKFQAALDSFSMSAKHTDYGNNTKGNNTTDNPPANQCPIAFAAYGSELEPQVQTLREIRENVLFSTNSGTTFMTQFNELYYVFGPSVSDWERQSPLFKEIVKTAITPMLSTMSILNYADIHSEQQMLGYGIGVILLNVGMYFVIPAIVIVKIKKRFWS
ncbi:MAG: peptidylprolyl isomerase [Candidatus Nitrosotenuis sp.]